MRSIKTVALVAATLLLVPQLAVAADLDTEVQDMKQRLEQMETQLQAQDKELAAAQEDRSATSALSSFLESTDISGFVAGGWNWTKTDGGSDDNTFAVQQYWIEMNKAPTEESRAGFDIALQGGQFCTVGGCGVVPGNANDVHLYTANVSYLAPIGSGLTVTAGIMPTLIGYEVENQNGNFFITRSLVWDQQPVTSTGATLNYGITDALSLTVGAINEPIGDVRFDTVSAKSITSLLSYSAEKFYLSAGLNWGKLGGGGSDATKGIFDLIATVNPTDALMIGANYDYHFGDDAAGAKDPASTGNAVSVFATYQVVEKTGVGARFDYVDFDADNKQWAITATVAQSITDGLTGKVEYRYNKDETDPTTDVDTNMVYVQMMYEF